MRIVLILIHIIWLSSLMVILLFLNERLWKRFFKNFYRKMWHSEVVKLRKYSCERVNHFHFISSDWYDKTLIWSMLISYLSFLALNSAGLDFYLFSDLVNWHIPQEFDIILDIIHGSSKVNQHFFIRKTFR